MRMQRSPVSPSGPNTNTRSSRHGASPYANASQRSCTALRTREYVQSSTTGIAQSASYSYRVPSLLDAVLVIMLLESSESSSSSE